MRALLLVGLVACGRVGFDAVVASDGSNAPLDDAGDAAGLQPLHRYPLHDSYEDLFGGPPLTPHGGGFIANRYQFGAGQGLSVEGAMPHDVYTLDMTLSFTTLDTWNKIVDFGDLGPDTGLYTYKTAVQYVIVPAADFLTSDPRFAVSSPRRLTTTRDSAGTVTAYVDGVPAIARARATPIRPRASSRRSRSPTR